MTKIKISLEGHIFQIVPWERRRHYFWNFEYPKYGEYDMLHIGTNCRQGFGKKFWQPIKEFFQKEPTGGVPYLDFPISSGLPLVVKRPHNFERGDMVRLNLSLEPIELTLIGESVGERPSGASNPNYK